MFILKTTIFNLRSFSRNLALSREIQLFGSIITPKEILRGNSICSGICMDNVAQIVVQYVNKVLLSCI